jgi:hypothetical protein
MLQTEAVKLGLETAQGISDLGFVIVAAGFFLVLAIIMMICIFSWFKTIINQIIDNWNKGQQELLSETKKQSEAINDLAEGLRTETQLRLRNLSSFAFDLSIEQVCRLIKKIREENNIADHEATKKKIRKLLRNIYEDRKSKFDVFVFRSRPVSSYCNIDWVERVAQVVEGEIYHDKGADNKRAYTNVKMVYDDIKLDFYHRLNGEL